ncbi:hypothetical protein ABD87_15130 [Lysinibacillus sphaericus]|uniref:hypothetical protein n=1 Tax=Lysinibacillus sphaericus TaxID=1421 RepID=UPI0018CFEB49|nr:hypothetical protein [Lysinibacillus sphaericus]MBG9730820.1 hypothetical protein [Lysinibacillus sphaericus]
MGLINIAGVVSVLSILGFILYRMYYAYVNKKLDVNFYLSIALGMILIVILAVMSLYALLRH